MKELDNDISFQKLFVPFTTFKASLLIIIVGLIVYINSLFNNFLGDDKIYIIEYQPSHSIHVAQAFGPSIFNTQGQYRPLPAVYFSLAYTLFGTNQFFYHIVQVVLHISCALLLFTLFRKFFSVLTTFFLILVFVIHPIQVESVSYISQTVSQLFFLFGILAFFISLQKNISFFKLSLIGFLLLLSVLTKETGILFLFLIIFYSFLFHRKYLLKFIMVGIVTVFIYIFMRYGIGHVGFDTRQMGPIAMAPLSQRVVSMPAIVFYYIKSLFFPVALAYDQQWVVTTKDVSHFYMPLLIDSLFFFAICSTGLLFINKHDKLKIFLFFSLWFFSGLFMILQIYPLDATVADRWFYFPLVGFLGVIGICSQIMERWSLRIRKIVVIIAGCFIILLSLRTMMRNTNWADAITLLSHDIRVSDNANIEENLAYELILVHRNAEAMRYLQKSVQQSPHSSSLYDLGYLYEQSHNYQKAEYYYHNSINNHDVSYGQDQVKKYAYDGMTRVLSFHDDHKKALAFLKKALQIYPHEGSYWAYLAITDYALKDQNEAFLAATKAKKLIHNHSTDLLFQRIANKEPLNLHLK